MFKQSVITALLIFLLSIGWSSTNPVPNDPSEWSTRITDNLESTSIDGSIKYNFDESEIDSSFSKREVSPVSGPLETPLVWGARIESPSSSSVGGADVLPSSVTGAGIVVGGDNKQKVDWALNPGDNKKSYSTNDSPDVIEQKKEDSVALSPETPKQQEDANADPYKDILPPVLTGKRRLVEGDKPVQSTIINENKPSVESTTTTKDSDKVSSPSLVDTKGHSGGAVTPTQSSDKSIPQHVYTEDQFPSVITIKGREYLVIPHKGNAAQPAAPTRTSSNSWYPDQGSFVQNAHFGNFGSPMFHPNPVSQSTPFSVPFPNHSFQPTVQTHVQSPVHSSVQSSAVGSSSVASSPTGETSVQHQAVPSFTPFHGQSFQVYDPSTGQIVNQKSPPPFTLTSKYPIHHSSAFKPPNTHTPDDGHQHHHQHPNQQTNNFPFFGQFPSSFPFQPTGPQGFNQSPHVTQKFEFFTPPSHHVTRVVTGTSYPVSAPSNFVSQPVATDSPVQSSESNLPPVNPNLVQDPSFSPKLQDPVPVQSSHDVYPQQEHKPFKPESNLHAPPQIPYGFSVVAGSYPVQSISSSSSSSSSSLSPPLSPPPSPPSLSPLTPSKTHVESPVTVTVDTKFPSYYSSADAGVKGASNPESGSPSVSVGSFNVNSAADQPVKGQSQQQDQQVGLAGETLVPTTIVDNRNQFIPNNQGSSSSGYFVSSIDPVSAYPSSFASFSSAASASAASPSQLGFPDQRKFFEPPWQYVYNYPVPVTSAGHFGSDSSATYNVHPHYSNGQLFYKSKRSGSEDFDVPQSYQ